MTRCVSTEINWARPHFSIHGIIMSHTNNPALLVVRQYHTAWSTGNFDVAANFLGDALHVEVPVNHYPDKASFVTALTGFGGLVRKLELLAEFGDGDQAMLLYDMEVDPLGTMRIAEHFTVVGGKIVRLRQIHDTAALRAAGFVREA